MALAGAPVQQPLRTGADRLGAGLRGLRLHPLPQPPHRPGRLGHRTAVPPPAPTPRRNRLCPAAGAGTGVRAGAAAGPGGERPGPLPRAPGLPRRPRCRAPDPSGPDQQGGAAGHRRPARRPALPEPRDGHPLAPRRGKPRQGGDAGRPGRLGRIHPQPVQAGRVRPQPGQRRPGDQGPALGPAVQPVGVAGLALSRLARRLRRPPRAAAAQPA
ncbi:hypothetical protein D9M68_437000 [compost metagenome]